ncbi:MAG TPA: CapA family protein [Fimbriimonas sp.]|nr:CapA family protein [Fimbriimonas sp.]
MITVSGSCIRRSSSLLATIIAAVPVWTLILGGDIMLNAVAPSDRIWKGIAPVVQKADLAVANLEIPLTDANTATTYKTKEELKRRDQFILKAAPAHAEFIAKAGWDVVGMANNHAMDYGPGGLRQMQALMRKWGIGYAGAGENADIAGKPAVFRTKTGFRVALVQAMAFVTWGALQKVGPAGVDRPGVNGLSLGGILDDSARGRLAEWIGAARQVSDFVIVGFHWGTERKTVPNPYQVGLARMAVDCGADIVWGHHPHVLQGAEVYNGRPIFYSAGNLISPLPAQTALFRLTYDRADLKSMEFLPASIGSGKVVLQSSSTASASSRNFTQLCREIQRKYPSKDSVVP